MPGTDGLLHISQIAEERVEKVTDYLKEGQEIRVKVLDVDARGRIKLSMKEVKVDVEEKIIAAVDEEGAGESAE